LGAYSLYMSFVLKMAWRDSRKNRARLFLFISAIISGIAALVAVRSFSFNLTNDIDREAKTLLGADIKVSARQVLSDSLQVIFKEKSADSARMVGFASMARFPKNGGTRLCQVQAIRGNFPFYGKWKTTPAPAWQTFRQGGAKALVDHSLMLQFGISVGDSVQVGNVVFVVEGDLLSSPGRAGVASSVAPVIYIPMEWLDSTGLVQRGSRLDYQYFYQLPDGVSADSLLRPLEKRLEKANIDAETVKSRQSGLGRAFGNVGTFLNLVSFVALLLGCIGVAGAVHLYIRDKLPTVAILRCLGASGRKAFYVYLLQVAVVGLLGAMAGALLGAGIQKVLPWVARDFLPIENVSTDVSMVAVGQGVLLGLVVAVLFALLPLAQIMRTSPLETLRPNSATNERSWIQRLLAFENGAILASVAFFLLFNRWMIGNWRDALAFSGGIALAFGVLWLVAAALTWSIRRFFPRKWPYIVRQGMANLFRPNNQTTLLMVTIGLGAMLLSTLFLTQSMLLKQVEFSGSGNQPNMILFDIQTPQKDSVAQLVRRFNMPLIQQVPIVTMRIEQLNGKTKLQMAADSSVQMPDWVMDREYRVTFRDTLIETEKLIAGTWDGVHPAGSSPVKISISDGLQKAMKADIGTRIVFNVQGAELETEVASVREVDFGRVQTNFLIVFPLGVLEAAPQFHVVVTRVESAEQSSGFQSELVRRYPGVSAIDLTQILRSVDEILSKVSFVIRFMAMFSILTGLLVLLSSIYQSKYARVRESVLLRTLGASRRQILWINAVEYLLLGLLACLAGIGLSVLAAWGLARFAFQVPFQPNWWPLGLTFLGISGLTLALGLYNMGDVLRKPPLEVLRNELG
jgi:putative ABC transport system permease protein